MMRRSVPFASSLLVIFASLSLAVACSSKPDDPAVDTGAGGGDTATQSDTSDTSGDDATDGGQGGDAGSCTDAEAVRNGEEINGQRCCSSVGSDPVSRPDCNQCRCVEDDEGVRRWACTACACDIDVGTTDGGSGDTSSGCGF